MKIVVSACLLGVNCKYSGGNNLCHRVASLSDSHTLIPVCPEVLGGLPTPRTPSEIRDGRVITADGRDVTAEFQLGAEKAMETVKKEKPDLIILQPRSPSCGKGRIYDGTFSGRLTDGNGIFAAMAEEAGYKTITSEEFGQ